MARLTARLCPPQALAQALLELVAVRTTPSLKPLMQEVQSWGEPPQSPDLDGLLNAMRALRDAHAAPLLSHRQFYSVHDFAAPEHEAPIVTVRRWPIDQPASQDRFF